MNLDSLNKKMISRQVENEFCLKEDGKTINSLLNVLSRDISEYSADVGNSLYGSFLKIQKELNNNLENLNLNLIEKYILYIEWHIIHLDITKIDDSLNLVEVSHAIRNNNRFSCNIIKLLFYILLISITNENKEKEKSLIKILKTILDKILTNNDYKKLKSFIIIFSKMFEIEKYKDVNLWEKIFQRCFNNLFDEYNLDKSFNENEILKYQKSEMIKQSLSEILKNNISNICNSLINKNTKFSTIYKVSKNLTKDINTLRNKGDFFSSSMLSFYLDILNEY